MAQTVSFVNISEVMDRLGLEDYEREYTYTYGFHDYPVGAGVEFTLMKPNWPLEMIVFCYEEYHKENIANKSMTEQMLRDKFWQIVGEQDFINMEN